MPPPAVPRGVGRPTVPASTASAAAARALARRQGPSTPSQKRKPGKRRGILRSPHELVQQVRLAQRLSATRSQGHKKVAQAKRARAPPKARRFKPGTVALREIRQQQRSTELCIPKLPFMRLVRELIADVVRPGDAVRIQASALEALQEAAESFLITEFEASLLCALHAKRVTLLQKDMEVLRRVRSTLAQRRT